MLWDAKIFVTGQDKALKQACTTYGPRAKCGLRKLFIWPAKPTIFAYLACLFPKNIIRKCKNMLVLALEHDKKISGPP
jgi:hypothetical protein